MFGRCFFSWVWQLTIDFESGFSRGLYWHFATENHLRGSQEMHNLWFKSWKDLYVLHKWKWRVIQVIFCPHHRGQTLSCWIGSRVIQRLLIQYEVCYCNVGSLRSTPTNSNVLYCLQAHAKPAPFVLYKNTHIIKNSQTLSLGMLRSIILTVCLLSCENTFVGIRKARASAAVVCTIHALVIVIRVTSKSTPGLTQTAIQVTGSSVMTVVSLVVHT